MKVKKFQNSIIRGWVMQNVFVVLITLLILSLCQNSHLFVLAQNSDEDETSTDPKNLAKIAKHAKKVADKRRKSDTKLITRILKNGSAGKHYAVLGLKNWEITIGPVTFGKITPEKVKQAYRKRARQCHPDKNRDPRAEQAFHQLDDSLSVLIHDETRQKYDESIRLERQDRIDSFWNVVTTIKDRFWGPIYSICHKFIRPFGAPILVLGALII